MRLTARILEITMWLAVAIVLALLWQIVDHSYLPPAGEARNVRFEYITLPELEVCGTNGEYRCMTDQDYMVMIGAIQEVRHLIDEPLRPMCSRAGCLCGDG